jgi:hypothetical protein
MNRIFAFLLAMFLIMGICFGCAKDEPIVETEPATTEMVIEEEKSTIPRVETTEPETEPEPEE